MSVRVTVPATTANLGPGFDCLGLALGLRNAVEMDALSEEGLTLRIEGEGAGRLPSDASNMLVKAAQRVFERAHRKPEGLAIRAFNAIPSGSGLGSSAAALVGGTVAANALLDKPLSRDDLLQIAVEMEGHPDNVSAALLGGLVASSYTPDALCARRVPVASMQVAVALPDVRTSTREMRAALPQTVPLVDATANIGRAVLVVQALMEGDYDLLCEVMKDRLHEPYRRKVIPGYDHAVQAAFEAGAAAIAISGAGPSLVAFAPKGHKAITEAMVQAFRHHGGVNARSWVLPVDLEGAQIVS